MAQLVSCSKDLVDVDFGSLVRAVRDQDGNEAQAELEARLASSGRLTYEQLHDVIESALADIGYYASGRCVFRLCCVSRPSLMLCLAGQTASFKRRVC
jgi:hypothetical protein